MHRSSLLLSLVLLVVTASAQQTPARESKYVNVFGARIHYIEAGSGPTVVLVHGLADDTTVWKDTVDALSKSYRVIVPDQIGFGKSDKPALTYRVGTFSDFLAEFLAQLKIERAILVGNSLGGWVVAHTAIQYPQRVAGLVVLNGVGYSDIIRDFPMPIEWLEAPSLEETRKSLPFLFYDRKFYEGAAGERAARALFEQRVVNQDGYTISRFIQSFKKEEDVLDGRLGRIRVPTLVLWGESDTMVPVKFAERMHREIHGSRLVRIPRCGHIPHVECPAAFNHELVSFLNSTFAAK